MTTITTSSSSSSAAAAAQQHHGFEVFVSNDSFKFNAAHFVAFRGYRERLHGHNYRVSVRLRGSSHIGPDGYVLDFGCIKAVTRQVCKELNEHFLCPTLSNVMTITTTTNTTTTTITPTTTTGNNNIAQQQQQQQQQPQQQQQQQPQQQQQQQQQVRLECEDGSVFVFPRQDCAMLPLVHATTEELAIYLWGRLLEGLQPAYLRDRGIQSMEVTVSEAPSQEATFRREIPVVTAVDDVTNSHAESETSAQSTATATNLHLDVRDYIQNGEVVPMPCLPSADGKRPKATPCTCCCQFSQNLQLLADAINQQALPNPLTVQDLQHVINHQSTKGKN